MPLSNTTIIKAKPSTKPYKLADSGGLYLLVNPNGTKLWRYKYRFDGKEKLLSIGAFPAFSLNDARDQHLKAKKLLANGADPSGEKKEKRLNQSYDGKNSLQAIAREWHSNKKTGWSERYAGLVLRQLEADIFPKLGKRHIASIKASELLAAVRLIEKRGALEVAHRNLQHCNQIFMYAIITERAERNPAADLKGALQTPVKKHYAHLKEVELPKFLKTLENYDGELQTKLAVELLIITFVRTTELRASEFQEFDLKKAEWRIPGERMKMRKDEEHIVPLSRQAIEIIKELIRLNGHGKYLFPQQAKPMKYMSENTILFALYRMGYHSRATGHGFRHTASTILNENGFDPLAIDRQMAHIEKNKVRRAYNHAQYLPERREMMQWWADYLDGLRSN